MTCAGLIPGPYDIRNYEYESYAIATNMCPEGPYRGVGMVTAVLAHERLMDLIAGRLALDPAEVRRVNFVTQAQMPYVAATGHPYESGDYGAALDAALAAFGYAGAREEQVRARAEGRRLGIGIGSYVEFTGAGSSTFEGRGMADIPGTDTARLWLGEDGRVHLQTTCPAIGQGVHTTFAQVAAASLGVEPENIVVEQTDTSRVGPGTGAFMSRGSVTAATSAYRAGRLLREAILSAASWRLDQPVERLSIGASAILVDGQRSSITLSQLAASDLAGNGGHAASCARVMLDRCPSTRIAEAPIDNRSTGWSRRHEAALRMASRSSLPARYALVAAVTEPRLMNAPVPGPTRLVSVCSTTMFSGSTPRLAAATCAKVVRTPCPIAGHVVCRCTRPSSPSQRRAVSVPGISAMPRPSNVEEPAPVNSTYEPMPMPSRRPSALARTCSSRAPEYPNAARAASKAAP